MVDLTRAIDELAAVDPVTLSDDDVMKDLPALLLAVNSLNAVVAGFIATFDARNLSQVYGYRATRTWLTAFGKMSQGAASAWLAQARLLRVMPMLDMSARRGDASSENLRRIADLAGALGGPIAIREYDELLAQAEASGGQKDVREACVRIHRFVDPPGARPDPELAHLRRALTLTRTGSMVVLRGQLDPEGAENVVMAMNALMKPPNRDDERTMTQRRADALIELARLALARGDLPLVGGMRPRVGILLTPEAFSHARSVFFDSETELRRRTVKALFATPAPRGGWTDERRYSSVQSLDGLSEAGVPTLPDQPSLGWFGDVAYETAQRLLCDCEAWRIILDPATSLPLDVGRSHRIAPHWIRKALHARDQGCRWPGCDAVAAWTDAHHVIAWYYGGQTRVEDMVSVCRWHHVKIHEGRWTARLDRTTGAFHVTQPDGTPHPLGPTYPRSKLQEPTTRPDNPTSQ